MYRVREDSSSTQARWLRISLSVWTENVRDTVLWRLGLRWVGWWEERMWSNDDLFVSILDRASFSSCLFFFLRRRKTFSFHHHDQSISYIVASCNRCTCVQLDAYVHSQTRTTTTRVGHLSGSHRQRARERERKGAKMALFSSAGSERHVRLYDRRGTELVDKGRREGKKWTLNRRPTSACNWTF